MPECETALAAPPVCEATPALATPAAPDSPLVRAAPAASPMSPIQGVFALLPPPPQAVERMVQEYEDLLKQGAEEATAEGSGGAPSLATAERIAALEDQLIQQFDVCCTVRDRANARAAVLQGPYKYYAAIAEGYKRLIEAEEAVVSRLDDKLHLMLATRDDKRMVGERFRARLQAGRWQAVRVEDDAEVPEAARKVTVSVNQTVLAQLAKAGQAPGWAARQALSLRIDRV